MLHYTSGATGWRGEPPRLAKRDLLTSITRDHGAAPVKATMPARNTLDATFPDGTRRVRLWHTDILTFRPDGGIEVDNGGWNSVTTRARLRDFLPKDWGVWTEQGVCSLIRFPERTATPFLQRITINPDNSVTPDRSPAEVAGVRKLIDRFIAKARKVGIPTIEDSRGDPWMLRPELDKETALDWLESEYWTRTCFALAHKAAGATDFGIAYALDQAQRRGLDGLDCRRIRSLFKKAFGLA